MLKPVVILASLEVSECTCYDRFPFHLSETNSTIFYYYINFFVFENERQCFTIEQNFIFNFRFVLFFFRLRNANHCHSSARGYRSDGLSDFPRYQIKMDNVFFLKLSKTFVQNLPKSTFFLFSENFIFKN